MNPLFTQNPFPPDTFPPVLGVVLAGGRSRRMGGRDKTLLPWRDATLLQAVAARAAPQVDELILSANRPSATLDDLRLPIVPDTQPDYPGPLAGIVSAMQWSTRNHRQHQWLASFAADTPFLPTDFVARCLQDAIQTSVDVAYASSGGRLHYAMAVWRMDLLTYLQQQLSEGERALKIVLAGCKARAVTFSSADDAPNGDPFFNINTPEDWTQVQRFMNAK